MNELIERLKTNEKAWVFLTAEEQKCMREVNKTGAIGNLKYDGEWECFSKPWALLGEGANEIWRIKSNYQPQPEYVDYPVATFESGGERWLGIFRGTVNAWTHLHCLPSLPGFRGFRKTNSHDEIVAIHTEDVAPACDRKEKVVARFDK